MVAQVEHNASGSLELLPRWPGRLGLKPAHSSSGSTVPRCAASDISLGDLLGGDVAGVYSAPVYHHDVVEDNKSDTASSLSSSSIGAGLLTFEPQSISAGFEFRPQKDHGAPRISKRYRHLLDVDGPNTAALSCKKRRLRSELITSRLSQPYSQPATHILNREGMKSGDKRFLKMATSLDVARRIAHLHATSFLRFSVMNRLRRRLGLWRPAQDRDQEERDQEERDQEELDTTSKAPWKAQTLEASSGGQYLRPSRDASAAGSSHAPKAQACRLSKPTALPLPPADMAAAKSRTSSRIHPVRSPEMRPECGAYDELDDDCFGFLHLDEDALGDSGDDPEHVYSDFSVIFAGGASDDDQSYEEYLDELDGISWATM